MSMKQSPLSVSAERGARAKEIQHELGQLHATIQEAETGEASKSDNAPMIARALKREYKTLEAEWQREVATIDGDGAGGGGGVLGKGMPMRSAVESGGPDVTLGQIIQGRGFGRWGGMSSDVKALLQSSDAGGAIPGAVTAGIVDLARETSCVFQAGAVIMPIESPNAKVARLVSAPTAEWAPESPSRDLTDGSLVFDTAELAVDTVFLYTEVSIESSEDCLNLDAAVTNHFSRQLALIFDEAGLAGTGADQPVGLCNMDTAEDRVIEMNAIGALVDHRPFVRAMGAVRAKHYQPTSVILTPGLWTELNCLQDTTNQPLRAPKAYTDLSEFTSSFLPDNGGVGTDEHACVVGDLSAMVFGVRTGATLEISRLGDGFKKGSIAVRAYLRLGMYLTNPEAICIMRGLTLPA